ncbi:MAG: hypothetical protein LBG21_05830 [Campylobacteraceae bacterium]|jgi:tetratricopeptide (TPR) repeat protein|nr:hypothetical protein [Campylobacteraceae bacterium]
MLKTKEVLILEERWKELRNKKIFKKIIIFFSILLLVLSLILLYLILNTQNKDNITNANNISLNASVNQTTNTINSTDVLLQNNFTTKSDHSIDSLADNKNKTNSNVNKTVIKLPEISYIGPQIIIEPPEEKKIIIETSNIQNINELIKKFENTNNIIFANMISEEFFDKKDYKKSLKFALKANEIDPKNESSWIMFAKSQVKLGNKQDAIKALEIFTKSSKNSKNAINLLQRIKSGEFK